MSDISASSNKHAHAFQHSRWFTCGWTLQELIAPQTTVEFFSADGAWLGDRNSLLHEIQHATGISLEVLQGSTPLSHVGVEEKMSWVKKHETTRPEDRAYCLLGAFDVQIEVLYGEGEEQAFRRLVEEIYRFSDGMLFVSGETFVLRMDVV